MRIKLYKLPEEQEKSEKYGKFPPKNDTITPRETVCVDPIRPYTAANNG